MNAITEKQDLMWDRVCAEMDSIRSKQLAVDPERFLSDSELDPPYADLEFRCGRWNLVADLIISKEFDDATIQLVIAVCEQSCSNR